GPSLTFSVDKAKLRAAVDNIISNAVSFSPQNGVVSVYWRETEAGLEITVIDDGPGISERDQARIFEAFYQGEARRQGSYKGTGLGLSIVWECMTAQGGRANVRNEPGRGAAFILELPNPHMRGTVCELYGWYCSQPPLAPASSCPTNPGRRIPASPHLRETKRRKRP